MPRLKSTCGGGRHRHTGLLMLMLAPAPLWAIDPAAFSLSLSHQRTDWQYPAGARATIINRGELRLAEPLTRRVSGTLYLSYLDLDQPDNPLAAARNASGNGAGLDLRADLLGSEILNLSGYLAYGYQTATGRLGAQHVEFVWHRWRGGLDFTLFPAQPVSLLGGASFGRIDGEQRNTGTLTSRSTFTESQPDRYHLGIRWHPDSSGRVELKAYTGAVTGLQLTFRRRY